MFCQSLRVDVAQFEFFAALYPPFGMFRQPQIVFSNSEHHFPRYGVGEFFCDPMCFFGTIAPTFRVVEFRDHAATRFL